MSVTTILNRKGTDVLTVRPEATVREAVTSLAHKRVGALVVNSDGLGVEGIVSERDVVWGLAAHGQRLLDRPVTEIMSTDVTTCRANAAIDDVMAEMTNRRIRHIPVVEDGHLAGIVSIGDVVKHRIDELELQAASLQEYVLGRAD